MSSSASSSSKEEEGSKMFLFRFSLAFSQSSLEFFVVVLVVE